MRGAVRARRACSPRAGRSWSCTRAGATPPACSTSPSGSRAGRGQRAARQLRARGADVRRRRAPLRELCERLGVQLDVRRPVRVGATAGGGNLQAWARDERYARGRRPRAGPRRGRRRGPHALRSGRDDPLPARVLAEPPRGAGDARPRRRAGAAAAAVHARADRRVLHATRGLRWRDDESNDSAAYARNRIRRELVPALERDPPGRAGQRPGAGRDPAGRGRGARRAGRRGARRAGREIALDAAARAAAGAAAARACSGWPTPRPGAPAAGVARRADEVAAMPVRGTSALDLPSASAPPPRRGADVRAHAQGRAPARSAGRRRKNKGRSPHLISAA